ncbi:MAG: FHA domain-containing protein [Chloroflexota bacterium]
MTKAWQVYYNAIFGAIGGLLAWLLVGLISTTSWDVHLANAFSGAGIGFFIGGSLGSVEGLVIKRSALRTILGAVLGTLSGLLSGMLGLYLGGVVFVLSQGGLLARILGWMIFGLFLGLGLGAFSLQLRRVLYSLIGGTLAGLVGGALYEIFTQLFLPQSAQAQVFLSAIALVLIGMSLGCIIPLSVSLIGAARAERGIIVYLSGQRANTEVEIIGSASLGSSDACDVYVQDVYVEKRQAQINKTASGFEIQNIGSQRSFKVDQQPVPPGQSLLLEDGAILQMGEIEMRFQAR